MKFHVPGMSCGHCVAAITKGVQAADPGAAVDCDLAAHTVSVASGLPAKDVLAAIGSAGYEAAPL